MTRSTSLCCSEGESRRVKEVPCVLRVPQLDRAGHGRGPGVEVEHGCPQVILLGPGHFGAPTTSKETCSEIRSWPCMKSGKKSNSRKMKECGVADITTFR